jgi:hypothetical protein
MLKLDSVGNHTLITLSCADDPAPIRFGGIALKVDEAQTLWPVR